MNACKGVSILGARGFRLNVQWGNNPIRPRHEAHLVGRPFVLSRGIHFAQKRRSGPSPRAAAILVHEGESIIISGGTTTFALTDFLRGRVLDVLTNSIAIVTELLTTSRNRVTIPGGTVFREQNIILSPFENDTIRNFRAEKMFMSCFGIDSFGVMEADPLIAQSQARLLQRTEKIIVMAEQQAPAALLDDRDGVGKSLDADHGRQCYRCAAAFVP